MTNDSDQILDDLLSRWHAWQQGDRGVRGFNHKALLIGDTRAMRVQYEAQIERQDDEHDALQCRAVDFAARNMEDPWRAAIYVLARNLHTGRDVWLSPRLPSPKAERDAIIAQARQRITVRLMNAGVM